MKSRIAIGCVLLLSALVSSGHAAEPAYRAIEQRLSAEQMKATGLDTLTAEQLALLNRLLAETTPQTMPQETVGRPSANAADAGREDPARSDSLIGFNDEPIRSRLAGTVAGWEPGTVFVLANGQQWKVLKGQMRLSKPLQDPEVVVVPGVAGRWFLQVHEDAPKARVYRID